MTKLHSLKIDTHLTSQLLSLIFTNIFLAANLSSDEGKDIFNISNIIHEILGMENWKILANLETLNKCTRSISCYIHNFGYIGRNKKHRCFTSLSKLERNNLGRIPYKCTYNRVLFMKLFTST